MADTSFGLTFAQITASSITPSFEVQFSQIQNTLIRRVNDEIANLNDDLVGDLKLRRLREAGQKLIEAQPVIEEFLLNTRNSLVSVQDLTTDLGNLSSFLGDDDSVTQDEVDAFTAQRDELANRIDDLFIFANVDIPNFDAVKNLKDQSDSFRALTAVVGTKADNAAVTTGVTDLTTRATNAQALVAITVEQGLDVSLNIQGEFAEVDADIIGLETLSFLNKQAEIDTLRANAANLLQVFSLAFEGQANFLQELASSLQPSRPEPGSILNIFT